MARITINGVSFDPDNAAAAAMVEAPDAAASNYILIQTREPLTAEQRAELADLGVRILEYVPENTYLCNYPDSDLNEIRALPYVVWANVYMTAFKVAPSLLGIAPAVTTIGLATVVAESPSPADTPVMVDVVFHDNVNPEEVRESVAATAGVSAGSLPLAQDKVRLMVPPSQLPRLAEIDEVRHIEEAPVYQFHNNVARGILGIDAPQGAPLALSGEGQVIAVADSGFDRGTPADTHPAFTGRVRRLYALGRPGDASDPHGHGTHVAGSVLGDGASAALASRVRGTAPAAALVLQSVLDPSGGLSGLPINLGDLLTPPYAADGARVHTNSWGSISPTQFGRYTANCRELDAFVWANRDCVVCFSAGNEGQDRNSDGQIEPSSVTPPGTAKNCITVGASENLRPDVPDTYGGRWPLDFPVPPIASDRIADNPDGVVAFSSRGPTVDQRIKPDVVAPGTFVLSARSRAATGTPRDPSADPLYYFNNGTSMATPLVAGCAALVREHLIKSRGINQPSAALVKALLINGAQNINGQFVPSEAGNIPNHAEGFGRVNVAATVAAHGGTVELRDEATALDVGDEDVVAVEIPADHRQLKVTLVWTDPPGEVLQNDLDLIVRAANGDERRGNAPPGSEEFDRVNNVEQVIWPDLPPGQVEIVVRVHRITALPQSYALVWRLR